MAVCGKDANDDYYGEQSSSDSDSEKEAPKNVAPAGPDTQSFLNWQGPKGRQCSRYDIKTNMWAEMPLLNVSRYMAGGCFSHGHVLVFCGTQGIDGQKLSSFERIRVGPSGDFGAAWELIQPNLQSFVPRKHFLVAPLSNDQVAILGG